VGAEEPCALAHGPAHVPAHPDPAAAASYRAPRRADLKARKPGPCVLSRHPALASARAVGLLSAVTLDSIRRVGGHPRPLADTRVLRVISGATPTAMLATNDRVALAETVARRYSWRVEGRAVMVDRLEALRSASGVR
jgi:hypothetical protein